MAETKKRDANGRYIASHGGRHSRLYKVWCAMKERCCNPHNKRYMRYGGRGITVCGEWKNDFAAFRDWALNNGYSENLTIDRIDNNKEYSPYNCRWVTPREQNRNYSRNHMITFNGKTQCVVAWSEETGINRQTILWRINNGKALEEVFSKKDGRRS